MSRRKEGNRFPPFVALFWKILNSKAYMDLRPSSAKALPYFLGKYKGNYYDLQRYLFTFSFSYSEANKYGFSNSTFFEVIQDVIRKGFIDPVDKGGLRGDGKSYNLFRLSRRWETYGTQDFESIEWKTFCPKPRLKATPKIEIYNSKKGNKEFLSSNIILQTEVVEGVLT